MGRETNRELDQSCVRVTGSNGAEDGVMVFPGVPLSGAGVS